MHFSFCIFHFLGSASSPLRAAVSGALAAGLSLAAHGAPARGDEPAAAADKQPPAEKHRNRLARETSPYLLLHAHNPVDWYPWGEEALNEARKEKKLIFLSIGYSSCYWCHVMERESFSDEEIAAYLNEHFVCIKVDREERPDIDAVYMRALEMMGRRGGWPLSMFLTPEALPLFGGTYFPPRDKELPGRETDDGQPAPKQRMTGLLTVLKLVEDAWRKSPDEARRYGEEIAGRVKRVLAGGALVPAQRPGARLDDEVLTGLAGEYDPEYGGFGYDAAEPHRPKFPEPANLVFLIDRVVRRNDAKAREMLLATLDQMAAGGICDHLGGGFHRYSTDRYWRIPHFEKMLYDNAQLAGLYARAFQLAGRTQDAQVAEEILAFVGRELTDPGGGFYTAIDAETDGDEGAYYVWTRDELENVLGDDFPLAADVYGVSEGANFEGRSVLVLPRPLAQAAARHNLSVEALAARRSAVRDKLLAARQRRRRPLIDTKVLTGFNGLMIRGFADAGRLFDRPQYVERAVRAAEFVLEHSRTPQGRLLHACTAGQGRLNAYLDDYAFFVDGLIALHQATGDQRWLRTADELTALEVELFWDDANGGFFFTSHDHEQLIARGKNPVDSVVPSGNAVSAANLVYLARELKKPEYLERAEKTVLAFSGYLDQVPTAMPQMVLAWLAVLEAKTQEQ